MNGHIIVMNVLGCKSNLKVVSSQQDGPPVLSISRAYGRLKLSLGDGRVLLKRWGSSGGSHRSHGSGCSG